jgi:alpha-glucosidase
VAAANGGTARTVRVPLTFLGQGPVQATLARDDSSNAAALKMERVTLSATDTLTFELRAGGGFVARLIP